MFYTCLLLRKVVKHKYARLSGRISHRLKSVKKNMRKKYMSNYFKKIHSLCICPNNRNSFAKSHQLQNCFSLSCCKRSIFIFLNLHLFYQNVLFRFDLACLVGAVTFHICFIMRHFFLKFRQNKLFRVIIQIRNIFF